MKVNNEEQQASMKNNKSNQSKETNLHNSWNTIVDILPQQQPTILNQITSSTQTSVSSITMNTSENKRRKKKDKVDEFIKSWENKKSTITKIKIVQPKSSTQSSSTQTPNALSQLTYERQRSSTSDVSHSVATDKRTKESKTSSKKRLPIFRSICKSQKNKFKQQGLKAFGFKHKVSIKKNQNKRSLETTTCH